jgi:hypothetical protein
MRIHEAAYIALKELKRPAHLREILQEIEARELFVFTAADPLRALGVQIDRRARGVNISNPVTPSMFYRERPATYGLLEWLDKAAEADLALDEDINRSAEIEALDSALFLEQELQRWLFKNWEQSRLTALGFGPLELVDGQQQTQKFGKYNTREVGEIDLLFTTASGDYVVCELKRQSDDQTIGQICRYWGWVNERLAKGRRVHGLVLAQEIGTSLKFAIKATDPSIAYRELRLDVQLGPSER